ncbi:hypothetical protein B0G76_7498 [Paraburkholderia sp. BL23I1N1]|uniref:hypothetical protein n=1 Tax=Paraburkholderia sp. BL23I1N1 TaxID=1938802 RepID=UPI000E734CC7|nr:hypothetical protein [Paraburkholderia sp. BL23I1N1]RKE25922.1 hypothetical protein B0G76_7498 [Paraburkholderia sp. BL23I1N1]
MKTLKPLIRASVCAGISLSLAGCLTSTPHWDAHFGETIQQITAAQILSPQASSNTDPVAGLDGGAAAASMFHYSKTFAQPPIVGTPYGVGLGTSNTSGTP